MGFPLLTCIGPRSAPASPPSWRSSSLSPSLPVAVTSGEDNNGIHGLDTQRFYKPLLLGPTSMLAPLREPRAYPSSAPVSYFSSSPDIALPDQLVFEPSLSPAMGVVAYPAHPLHAGLCLLWPTGLLYLLHYAALHPAPCLCSLSPSSAALHLVRRRSARSHCPRAVHHPQGG